MAWRALTEIKETRRVKRFDVDLSEGKDRKTLVAGRWSWTINISELVLTLLLYYLVLRE